MGHVEFVGNAEELQQTKLFFFNLEMKETIQA